MRFPLTGRSMRSGTPASRLPQARRACPPLMCPSSWPRPSFRETSCATLWGPRCGRHRLPGVAAGVAAPCSRGRRRWNPHAAFCHGCSRNVVGGARKLPACWQRSQRMRCAPRSEPSHLPGRVLPAKAGCLPALHLISLRRLDGRRYGNGQRRASFTGTVLMAASHIGSGSFGKKGAPGRICLVVFDARSL